MQFVQPQPFHEAVRKLGRRSLIASQLNSEQWSRVPLALRERAFFSARVESARFLQTARNAIADYLQSSRKPAGRTGASPVPEGASPSELTVLSTPSRADFITQLQDFAVNNGLGDLEQRGAGVSPAGSSDVPVRVPNTLTNLASERRLGLIFDVQTRQAQDFGYWQQGMDPDVLDAYPAQRFIRVQPVKEPRSMHQHHEGEVHLKSDLDFWIALNQDFGVPWGPWGWGCGHDVEDVDRDTAESLGLLKPGQKLAPPELDFNHRLAASVATLDDPMRQSLQNIFADQVRLTPDTATWTASEAS